MGGSLYYSADESNARGVTTLIKNCSAKKIIQQIADKNGRYLIIIIQKDGEEIAICNLYAPNCDKPEFFLQK